MKKQVISSLLLLIGMLSCLGVFLFAFPLGRGSLAAIHTGAAFCGSRISSPAASSQEKGDSDIGRLHDYCRCTQLSIAAKGGLYRL